LIPIQEKSEMARKSLSMQLACHLTGAAIMTAGGAAIICLAGSTAKLPMYVNDSAVTSVPLTYGKLDCEIDIDHGEAVDIYLQSPTGHGMVAYNIVPSGPTELRIDRNARHSVLRIPFHVDDADGETATGFVEPTNGLILPNPVVTVATADAGITVDVGTISTDSGDADGFMDGVSVAATGLAKASLANGAVTLGALLKAQDSANAGDAVPEGHVGAGKAITYTLTGSPDTAAGVISIPVLLG
jgi:hypothetical protein